MGRRVMKWIQNLYGWIQDLLGNWRVDHIVPLSIGTILWITGNSGSGKTTLANKIKDKFNNWVVLDGDEMRESVSRGLTLTKEDRIENNIRVANLAKVISNQDKNVVVSSIAPYQEGRDLVDGITDVRWIYLEGGKKGSKYPYEIPNIEPYKNIDDLRLFNVYLLGLPRSGTSMMTKVLELLGVNMIHTSEENKEKTDERFKKKYGYYHANITGFYEITEDPFENMLKVLSTPYSGCKMILPVTGYRWEILTKFPSKVIMMTRDAEEIRQSQMAYYRSDNIDPAVIRSQLATQKVRLEESDMDYMIVDYRHVLEHKEKVIPIIADFIKAPNGTQEALDFINPNQNRFKKENLTDGL